jgi:hypothetical protein
VQIRSLESDVETASAPQLWVRDELALALLRTRRRVQPSNRQKGPKRVQAELQRALQTHEGFFPQVSRDVVGARGDEVDLVRDLLVEAGNLQHGETPKHRVDGGFHAAQGLGSEPRYAGARCQIADHVVFDAKAGLSEHQHPSG